MKKLRKWDLFQIEHGGMFFHYKNEKIGFLYLNSRKRLAEIVYKNSQKRKSQTERTSFYL